MIRNQHEEQVIGTAAIPLIPKAWLEQIEQGMIDKLVQVERD